MTPPTPPSPPKRQKKLPVPSRQVLTERQPHKARDNRRKSSGRPVRHEISAGGVVARLERQAWLVALLKTEHKRGEVWVLPKGHVEPEEGETVSEAAIREVKEEAGITSLSIKEQLGITRYSFQAEDALIRKTVHYFLMVTSQKKLTPQKEEFLIDAEWQPIDDAINQLEYDTDKNIVAKAREKLTGQPAKTIGRRVQRDSRTKSRPPHPNATRSNGPSSNRQGPSMRIHT